MSADIIHPGHLKVIEVARALGQLTVGVLADKAIASYKQPPRLNFEQRKVMVENIKGVHDVILQETLDYRDNLLKLKPNYVVHGDNWKTGPQSKIRKKVIELIKTWGGELVEPPYTKEYDSDLNPLFQLNNGITPSARLRRLRMLIETRPVVRIMEAHNGLTGLIVENTRVQIGHEIHEFDGIWESSLTDSTSKGKPDTSAVDVSSRISTIDQILDVTTKPMIVDADNGGQVEHFKYTVRHLERLGVSATIIEDKIGIKRNSLFGTDRSQTQDSIEEFCFKISEGKKSQVTKDFMIIARIESLVLEKPMSDAIDRAKAYVNAGADGIMIHSKAKTADEVFEFCEKFTGLRYTVPIVVVPTAL
ncbi:MAG: isocitrate lyase/phosphoenolpyruvate mutase family protein [Bdellovibrionales bacterium]|nr:isocitrate lyase/phosphoenolpyruvate mutase family protein [Bdellovibrionales bacterium]